MIPHPLHRHAVALGRRHILRRSSIVLAAALVLGGTPLVARAIGDEPGSAPIETVPPVALPVALPVEPPPPVESPPPVEVTVPVEPPVSVEETVPVEPPVPVEVTVPVPVEVTGPDPAAWAALRDCESGGDYTVTNPSGKYRGAYQFSRSTWDSVAGRHDPSLVGADPAAASPADQDAMAFALYAERGDSPWPHCGRHLR